MVFFKIERVIGNVMPYHNLCISFLKLEIEDVTFLIVRNVFGAKLLYQRAM